MTYNKERVELFRDDLIQLRQWHAAPGLQKRELLDASNLLFRWLLDRKPILQAVVDEAKLQLLLPSQSDESRAYNLTVIEMNPYFYFAGGSGTKPRLELAWRPLNEFLLDTMFYVNGTTISNSAFIKFVRNKLGGGHFDAEERKRWQIDLLESTNNLNILGQHPFNLGMKTLIARVLLALDGRPE